MKKAPQNDWNNRAAPTTPTTSAAPALPIEGDDARRHWDYHYDEIGMAWFPVRS